MLKTRKKRGSPWSDPRFRKLHDAWMEAQFVAEDAGWNLSYCSCDDPNWIFGMPMSVKIEDYWEFKKAFRTSRKRMDRLSAIMHKYWIGSNDPEPVPCEGCEGKGGYRGGQCPLCGCE